MLDINLIRREPDTIKKNLSRRNETYAAMVDDAVRVDSAWREKKQQLDLLRSQRNTLSLSINEAKKKGQDVATLITKVKELPLEIKQAEEVITALEKDLRSLLLKMPNLLDTKVPTGTLAEHNTVIKIFKKPLKQKFTPTSHVDLAVQNNWIDLDRAAKIAGSRWYFLKGDLAVLDMAIAKYGIDFMRKKGFTPVIPPFMMSRTAYEGVTDLGAFDEALYKIDGEDLYTIATSEHPLTAQYMNEILQHTDLPIKLAGYSMNFRKEAGAHGKDQKGIFRVHQFEKVEQIIICNPKDSWKHHEELVKNAIEFWKTLELPFRQVLLCTGEIGTVSAKTYDYEAWYPVQQAWREVGSCSNCLDYQARRLNIKYQDGEERLHAHTLNATLTTTTRPIVAIIENFQQKDGSVKIPKALWKYTGFKVMKPAHKKDNN